MEEDSRRSSTPWQSSWANISGLSARRVLLSKHADPITFAEVLAGWGDDKGFRAFFLAELRRAPFGAFFWELPPLRANTLERPYEHVVLEREALTRMSPNPSAFLSMLHAEADSEWVASFPNIGGDAILVVPKPLAGKAGYGHLGAFLQVAPDEQQHALLQVLGGATKASLQRSDNSIWISTAGLGVPWLHVRLDLTPPRMTTQRCTTCGPSIRHCSTWPKNNTKSIAHGKGDSVSARNARRRIPDLEARTCVMTSSRTGSGPN
jgi:hypothetical protein